MTLDPTVLVSALIPRTTCRACTEDLRPILNLGDLKLNAFPRTLEALAQVPSSPLVLMLCRGCGLLQLDRTVPPDLLYREYWYRSGINESMVAELEDVVKEARLLRPVGSTDLVVDIGANDGTLLAVYKPHRGVCPSRIGVEPARNLHQELRANCETVVPDYFPHAAFVQAYQGDVAIVTAIACCYDLEDPGGFFQGIRTLLKPGGIAIVQFQDFAHQLLTSAFDNICHEHLEYYTLWSLITVVRQAGLGVYQVQARAINGGSLRVVLRIQGEDWIPHPSIAAQLTYEYSLGLDTPAIRAGSTRPFKAFAAKVAQAQQHIRTLIEPAVGAGRVVDVMGASTKGNITLQVLGLGPQQIRQAIDRSPYKEGCYTITGIPIVGEAEGRRDPADVWLACIWQFRESLLQREGWYLEGGGSIVFPLPVAEVVRSTWGRR